jgi:hypothetical protein
LRVLALMLSTAVVLTATLIYRDAVDLRAALLASAEGLGRIIGETLVSPLLHEDVWRSFELIRTPFRTSTQASPEFAADVVVVLDPDARVFVSTSGFPSFRRQRSTAPITARSRRASARTRRACPGRSNHPRAITCTW